MRLEALARQPLIRLLVVNCAAGVAAALLMLGGLMALNPGNLRALIFADRMGAVALGLLLFGLTVTFGSVAMGTAIMALGRSATAASAAAGRSRSRPGCAKRGACLYNSLPIELDLAVSAYGPFPKNSQKSGYEAHANGSHGA